MTQNSRVASTLVKYVVDQQSVQNVLKANLTIAQSFASLNALTTKVNAASAAAASGIQQVAATTQVLTQAQSQGVTSLQAQLPLAERLAEAAKARQAAESGFIADLRAEAFSGAAGGAAGAAGGGIGRSISNVSRGLFNLPDVQLTPGISTTVLSRLGLVAGVAAEGLGLTAASLAGIGLVAVGAVAAIKTVIDAETARGEAAQRTADLILDAAKQISGGATSQDIRGDVRQLERQRDVLREGITLFESYRDRFESVNDSYERGIISADEYKTIQANLNAELFDATGGALGLKDGIGQVMITAGNFNGVLADNQKNLDTTNEAIASNTFALNSQGIAANDTAEALRRLTDIQVDAAKRTLEVDRLTAEQRDEEAARNQRNIEILKQMIRTEDLTTDAAEKLSVQIGELQVRNRELNSVMTSTADLQAREKQFRDNAAKALQDYNDQLQIEGDALTRAADIRQRMIDLETDTNEKRAAAIADAEDKRSEIAADGAERRQQIETDDADRRAEILKRFNTDYNNAVASRDALAAYKAKQTRDDELDKQDKASRKQLAELEKALDKQYRAVQKGLDRQQRSIDDAYNKQLRGLQRDLDQQNAIAANARQQALVLQRNYNQLEAQANLMHLAQQYKSVYDYGEMTYVYLDNLWRRIAAGAANLYNNGGYVVGGPDGGVYPGASVGGNNLARNVSRPNLSGLTSSTFGKPIRMDSLSGSGSRSIVFAPVINGARMTRSDFDRMSNDWFDRLRRM